VTVLTSLPHPLLSLGKTIREEIQKKERERAIDNRANASHSRSAVSGRDSRRQRPGVTGDVRTLRRLTSPQKAFLFTGYRHAADASCDDRKVHGSPPLRLPRK